uniref:Putative secreted protein n=1 Tax=Anopheles darlingi TaxID=43151 RepID=A0A2M4DE57_ANODA
MLVCKSWTVSVFLLPVFLSSTDYVLQLRTKRVQKKKEKLDTGRTMSEKGKMKRAERKKGNKQKGRTHSISTTTTTQTTASTML